MIIRIYLKNGKVINLNNSVPEDFELLIKAMRNFKKYFIWNDSIWIRKSTIVVISLENV